MVTAAQDPPKNDKPANPDDHKPTLAQATQRAALVDAAVTALKAKLTDLTAKAGQIDAKAKEYDTAYVGAKSKCVDADCAAQCAEKALGTKPDDKAKAAIENKVDAYWTQVGFGDDPEPTGDEAKLLDWLLEAPARLVNRTTIFEADITEVEALAKGNDPESTWAQILLLRKAFAELCDGGKVLVTRDYRRQLDDALNTLLKSALAEFDAAIENSKNAVQPIDRAALAKDPLGSVLNWVLPDAAADGGDPTATAPTSSTSGTQPPEPTPAT